ncbi:MAG: LPS-assembly protein LptD [Halioglobus sp.]|nr:LPS-assembly protein LptD [Halioglobus sp.]
MTSSTTHPNLRASTLSRLGLAVAFALMTLPALAQDSSEPSEAHPLDWTDIRDVPPELRDDRCIDCQGRYMDPLRDVDTSVSPDNAPINADASEVELYENTAILSGGVSLTQGYRQMRADQVSLDRLESMGILEGNITLREPGILLRGERAQIYSETGVASIESSQWVLHNLHMRGSANILERDKDGLLHIHDGELSYCAPNENEWLIQAEKLELNVEEGLAVARGAKIRIADVPVIYLPWIQFPIDDRRRSGVLWPDIGSDSRGGIDVAMPVYWNAAPNYDLLYTPRYIEERGINHEAKARYLNPVLGSWTFGGAFMDNDKRYEDDYPSERNYDRWLAVVRQNGLFEERWRSQIDYSKASDVNYMKDLQTSSLDSKRRTALLQLGALDYLGDQWMATLEVQQFQSLADDINNDYKKLPQLTGRYRPDGTPFEIDPIFLAQYSNFDTDTNRVTGERIYTEAGATYPMLWTYGFFKPTAKYRYLSYDLDRHNNFKEQAPDAGAPMINLDAGLFFDRDTELFGNSMVQTLEPRLYYLYSKYQDQTGNPDFDSAELTFTYNQLFRETRFSGRDRIDDSDQLSVGITTRFIDQEDGREEFNASLGQIFYFRDRKVRLGRKDPALASGGSEVAGELSFFPNERLSARTSVVWDPYSDKVNSGNFFTSYQRDNGSIYNVGYTYRRPLTTVITTQPPTEEAHFSFYVPTSQNWSVFAAVNYSIEAGESVEDMFGVEYDTCCWKVRLLHLRYFDSTAGENPGFIDPTLEREDSTQVQIVLKGMGGVGSRASGIMKDMIRGFTDSEY